MVNNIEKQYFNISISTSKAIHNWLASFEGLLESEIKRTLKEIEGVGSAHLEEAIVYLHYMYLYRYVLPTLEPFGHDVVSRNPNWARWQLLNCLMGRFLDDIVDSDSGFWNEEEIQYWYSYFLIRCQEHVSQLGISENKIIRWHTSLKKATQRTCLYNTSKGTRGIRCPGRNPLPLSQYPSRIPYFFWLYQSLGVKAEHLTWAKKYISALFYYYDVDDVFSDLLANVPTQPAYELLRRGLDDEGRIKFRKIYRHLDVMLNNSKKILISCKRVGEQQGLILGPCLIDVELKSFKEAFF